MKKHGGERDVRRRCWLGVLTIVFLREKRDRVVFSEKKISGP